MQSSAVITRSNIPLYYIRHCNDWSRIPIRIWILKGHPISHPNGRAMGCPLWWFQKKTDRDRTHHHDDVIKWKHFPRNWPFVRGIHRSRWIPHTKASDAELRCFLNLRLKVSWWRHQMETFSALMAICAGNSPVPGEIPAQRPVTRKFDVFFYLRLNKRLSKQPWGWWFETPSWSLWRQCNGTVQ